MSAGAVSSAVRPYSSLQDGSVIKELFILHSLMLGIRDFPAKLTSVVFHSLMVSIPFLRLSEVAVDRSPNPFAGAVFLQVLLTQQKMQEVPHHPYQDVTSPDTDASHHFFNSYH